MYKLAFLVAKNLGRNKIRTALTASAVVVLVMIYTVVSTITSTISDAMAAHSSETRLLVRGRWMVRAGFPRRFVPRITNLPGVLDWTVWNFYGGALDESGQEDRTAAGIATRVENLREMHPGLEDLDPAVIDALRRERTGMLVGQKLMKTMRWNVGQRFTFISATHPGQNLEFKVVGILPEGDYSGMCIFRDDYYEEGTGDKERVRIVWLRVADPAAGNRIASQLEAMYASGDTPLQVETESATANRVLSEHQSIVAIIRFIAAILLIDMAIVLSNSINIATQERRIEMGVLKVLGFAPAHVAFLVVGEAMLIGALSGLVGAGLTYAYSQVNDWEGWPYKIQFLSDLRIQSDVVPWGFVYGALIGLAGSVIPAWNARRIRVADVFSRVA
ncbi:MAG: ABC transporter permease [Pirellulales bacterium]